MTTTTTDTSKKSKKTSKKSEEPAILVPMLTSPAKSSRGTEKVALAGHERAASRLRECRLQAESLEAEADILAAEILPAAKAARLAAEVAGRFAKTVEVAVEDGGKPLQVILGDKYRKVAVEHEPALRSALKGQFDAVFQRKCSLSLRSSTTLEQLKEALGDKFEAFTALVDVEEHLQPGAGFSEARARIRPTLSPVVNGALDQIVEQIQIPSVRVK